MSANRVEGSPSGNRQWQRTILASVFVLALLVLVSGGIALRKTLLEKWYVHLVRTGQPEQQIDAVRQLASLGAAARAGDVWHAIVEHANVFGTLDDPWADSMQDAAVAFEPSILPFVLGAVNSDQEVISQYAIELTVKIASRVQAESGLGIEQALSGLATDERYDKQARTSAGEALNALWFRRIQEGFYHTKELSAIIRDEAASLEVREAAKTRRSWKQGLDDGMHQYWTQDQLVRWQQIKERMPALRESLGVPDEWVDVFPQAMFGFCVPPHLRPMDVAGIDSFIGEYQGTNIRVAFDYGRFSPSLENEIQDKRCKHEKLEMNGCEAILVACSWRADKDYSLWSAIHVESCNALDGDGVSIFAFYSDFKEERTIQWILKSLILPMNQ